MMVMLTSADVTASLLAFLRSGHADADKPAHVLQCVVSVYPVLARCERHIGSHERVYLASLLEALLVVVTDGGTVAQVLRLQSAVVRLSTSVRGVKGQASGAGDRMTAPSADADSARGVIVGLNSAAGQSRELSDGCDVKVEAAFAPLATGGRGAAHGVGVASDGTAAGVDPAGSVGAAADTSAGVVYDFPAALRSLISLLAVLNDVLLSSCAEVEACALVVALSLLLLEPARTL